MSTATPTPTSPTTEPPAPTGPADYGWGRALALIAVVVIAVGVMAVAIRHATAPSKHEPVTITYVVPKGTAAKVAAGEKVTIMPSRVELRRGDRLVIRNDDDQTATVGPYTVRAGETLKQWFQSTQTLTGECSLSKDGQVTIVVT